METLVRRQVRAHAVLGKIARSGRSVMKRRKILLNRSMAGAMAGTLILACSSKSSTPSQSGVSSTPPGTTVVTTAPYPACEPVAEGSFVTSNGGTYSVSGVDACTPAGMPAPGPADMHCVGVPPQPVNGADCDVSDAAAVATPDAADDDAGDDSGLAGADAGPAPTPGPCDENGTDGAYGSTMYGTEGDDDDCKYHVTYAPLCGNNGTYFVVTAVYLTPNLADGGSGPLTGASTFAEICLSDTHPGPAADGTPPSGNQEVVEGPPGTYTVGPVQFDESGTWTVRFHFNEFCCDVAAGSPHGHAAFFFIVP